MIKANRFQIIFLLCVAASTFLYPISKVQAAPYPYITGDNTFEWITNVTFVNINNTTAQDTNGYGNYTFDRTGIMTRAHPGNTYPLRVSIHPDTKWCNERVYAFIDWNHDTDFSDSGETYVVTPSTCVSGPHTVYVKVPFNAVAGETRMRVVLKYYSTPPSSGNIQEGEAEDYTIVVNYPTIIGDNRSEWITNVTIGNINNTTGRNSRGYGDYSFWATGKITKVTRDEVYPLRVTISPDSTWCNEYITAFIDWNHDGDFTDAREKFSVAANTCVPGPHVLNIRVPNYAVTGRTMMRVVMRWLYTPASSGYISGEAEDYTLFVNKRSPWVLFVPAIVGHK